MEQLWFCRRVHAVSICNTADGIYDTIGSQMEELGLKGVEPRDLIDIMDSHTLGGHGNVNKELKGEWWDLIKGLWVTGYCR